MKTLYTAEAIATGGGRDGHAATPDGRIDLDLAVPQAMGGSGDGANPEQLFAAGDGSASRSHCTSRSPAWTGRRPRSWPTAPTRSARTRTRSTGTSTS